MSTIFKSLLLVPCLLTTCIGQNLTSLTKDKCNKQHLIDISNGIFNHSTKNMLHENNVYSPDKYFKYEDKIMGCVCDVLVCVTKCCYENVDGEKVCDNEMTPHLKVNTYHENMTLAETDAKHATINWKKCSYIKMDDGDTYYITTEGDLYYEAMDMMFSLGEYCLGQLGNETNDNVEVRLCFDGEDAAVEDGHELNKYGMLISIPFLFITLIVYFILPDKKIQIKCLVAYLGCLMLSYLFLVYLQFYPHLETPQCQIIAACGVYFFMSTFCWMNITCIDMYWTFSGKRAPLQGRSSKWKLFGIYAIFANGFPAILLSVIFGINSLEDFTGHPQFGVGVCWIEDGLPQLLYFYGPMAFLLSINIVLFVITAHTIRSTIRENQKMLRGKESQCHCETTKQDYILYLKLFVAMGINWSMELLSWLANWCLGTNDYKWIWYPTDFCNAIYGMFIFIIFVCKRAVWIKLKQRYYVLTGQTTKARALSTRTSGYQMSQTERTHVDESTVHNANS